MRSRKPPSWAKAAMVLLCAKTATSTATAGNRPTIASATVLDVASMIYPFLKACPTFAAGNSAVLARLGWEENKRIVRVMSISTSPCLGSK